MKKILAFFLVVVVLLGSTQLTIYADNESQGQEITTSVTMVNQQKMKTILQ